MNARRLGVRATAPEAAQWDEAIAEPALLTPDVLDALPAAIYTTDAQGRVTSFNKACVTFSGRIPELGSDRWCVTWRLFWPDGTPMPFEDCPMAAALKEGRSISGAEAIAERPDGSRIWFAAHPTPVYDENHRLIGGVNMLVDITMRKAIELSLARRAREQGALYRFTDRLHRAETDEEIYDAALEAIVAGLASDRAAILLVAGDGVMRFVASRGLSDEYRAAVEGHSPWALDERHPQSVLIGDVAAADLDDGLKTVIAREGIGAVGFIPLLSGGRIIGKFMVYYDAPHAFEDADTDLALTIARQLAFALERRRAEEERRQTSAALVEGDRRKDEFLATLAHELRNPLGPIHTAIPLIEDAAADGGDASRWLEIVARQTGRLTRLVDDLMDVSRITRGYIELRTEAVDMVALVNRAIDAHAEEYVANGLTLERRLAAEPIVVEGDQLRLEQVVNNLISNAIKYTDAGGTVVVGVARTGETVEVTVRDTGIGIDPAFRRQMFTLFQQADRTLDRSKGGLGIGLTLARQLVELHGGSVEAESDGPGAGSLFTVRLPLGQAPERESAETGVVDRVPPRKAVDGMSRRVLIVDDNDDYAEVLTEVIGHLGHEVHVARDGREALRSARELAPDVVLLDIGLPGLNGYEVAEGLRGSPDTEHALIVAISGYAQAADRERSARSGIDAHIVKPIDLGDLERLLASASDSADPS